MSIAAVSCYQPSTPAPSTVDARAAAYVPPQPEPGPAPTLAVALYDMPPTEPAPEAQTRFSIANTRDLYICSTWSALEGEHFETRRFYAPAGELYYEKLIPFSTELDEPYPFTQPVTIPHAMMIRPVLPNARGELVVCDQLAVAGAWIGDHQLTGVWRLDVSLDDAKATAISLSFEITP